jgi:hypothetical protein
MEGWIDGKRLANQDSIKPGCEENEELVNVAENRRQGVT